MSTPSETILTATIHRAFPAANFSIRFEDVFSSESTTTGFSPAICASNAA
jgi:disulfide oxidoreductase YuzD